MLAIKAAGNYRQQQGIITRLGDYVARVAQRVLIISSPTAWQLTSEAVTHSLAEHRVEYSLHLLTGECTLETIQDLSRQAIAQSAGAVVGIGGGRVMDTAKGVAETAHHLPVITVPTVAATCAAWSPSSVLYNHRGGRVGLIDAPRAPVWVLVDSQIIAACPPRFLQAGMVDALAKWYEFSPYLALGDDALGLLVKTQAAKLSLEIISRYGIQALQDNHHQQVTPALRKVIDAVIAMAGIANSIKDDVPRSGIAHEIHDSMTHHRPLHHWLHGEKVGFALVVQALLQHPDPAHHQSLFALLAAFNSPMNVDQLGIANDPALYHEIADRVRIKPQVSEQLTFNVDVGSIAAALAATHAIDPLAWGTGGQRHPAIDAPSTAR